MKSIKIYLLDKDGDVQYGLNWGQRDNRDHNQAYLQLTSDIYKSNFFPPKGKFFVVETDDNKTIIMTRAQKDLGTALQVPDNNAFLGEYLRERLGVPSGKEITKEDILNAGVQEITFAKIDEMHYSLYFGEYKGNILNRTQLNDQEPLQVIYYGAPGTGKSYTIDKKTTEENSVRTTFHPDSDYASFVGAYKPTMEDIPVSAIVGKEVHEAVPQGKHTGKEKKIVYKYVPQAFLKAYVKAWGDLENPYYLIIEEINRGNCAQIFGDLFQLLDRNNMGASSYPILADEDITRFLNEDENGFAGLTEQQKNKISDFVLIKDSGERRDIGEDILKGKHLLLPPNLHIWATMNTSDQSLFPIDSAFKRRWDWEYMPIDYNPIDNNKKAPLKWKLKIGDNLYDWGRFLSIINPQIETLTESSDKQMGYFFVKAHPLTEIISEEVFKNKVLFYLWTEVLKDFDMGKDPFINPETKKTFKFTDFFDKEQNAVVNFIENLKLNPLNVKNESIDEEDEELEDIEETNDNISSIQYSINDGVPFKKTYLGLETLKAFITLKPEMSPSEIIEMWKASIKKPLHLIEDEDGYSRFLETSKGNRKKNEKRFEPFEYKGTKLYLWKGWGDGDQDNITPFMNIINDLDWGIKIKRVNETLD